MAWVDVIPLLTVVGANLGTVILLYNNLDKKIDENRKETTDILKGIQSEMKDFHIKLATQDRDFHVKMAQQDLEFKTRICAIEEKRNSIILGK